MKLGTGSNTERTQKYARVKVQNDIRMSKLLASERSERDTYRVNTIENRGCLFIYLFVYMFGRTYVILYFDPCVFVLVM